LEAQWFNNCKTMKIIVNVCVFLTILFLFSCQKQVLESDLLATGNSQLNLKGVTVQNGILCFKDESSVKAIENELSGKDYNDLAKWEESIGFNSIERASSDIMDAIFCRAEQLVAGGLSQEEVIRKFDSGEIQEVPDELQQKMDELKLVYQKDKDGLRFIDYSFIVPFEARFLNEKFQVVIADTLYQYGSDFIDVFPEFSKGKFSNPIRITRSFAKEESSLKSLDLTTSAQLCFDDQKNDATTPHRRLKTQFVVERRIYQQQGCVVDCIHSYTSVNIYYQGYWANWLGWVAGDYNLTYNGSFSVKINTNGTITTNPIPIYQTTAYSSPVLLYQTADNINSNIPWVAIGNVNCFYMTIGFGGFNCSFNIMPGGPNNGSIKAEGYSGYYYLYNNY
jgi:hypothetical protein